MWESPPWYRVMIYILHTPKDFHTDSKLSNYARVGIVCPLKTKKLGFGTRWWMIMIMTQKPYERKRERETDWNALESLFFLTYIYIKGCTWSMSMELLLIIGINHSPPIQTIIIKDVMFMSLLQRGWLGFKKTHTHSIPIYSRPKKQEKRHAHTQTRVSKEINEKPTVLYRLEHRWLGLYDWLIDVDWISTSEIRSWVY